MTDEDSFSIPEAPSDSAALELVSDGDGVLVIGNAAEVERFLTSQGLEPASRSIRKNLPSTLASGARIMNTASEAAANSDRWVQLTSESAAKVAQFGLTPTTTPGINHAMIGDPGHIQSWIQIVQGPASIVTNPAMLTGAAGIMAQIAMQQRMEEITDYLAVIDEKVDDVLRALKDAAFADMIAVSLMIDEAMTIRDEVGRVSDVTWSKVQSSSMTIAKTQAYALRQIDSIAEKLERKTRVADMADAAVEVKSKVGEWLAVLAHCVQLQEAIAVLELDRVMDASPEELDQHRVALRVARKKRLTLIAETSTRLVNRMRDAAKRADSGVLSHPIAAPSVVQSSNVVVIQVADFHERLGLTQSGETLDGTRWKTAAQAAWDDAVTKGAHVVDVAGQHCARAVQAFQAVDRDGDGIADKPRALSAAEDAQAAVSDAAAGAAGSVTSWIRRGRQSAPAPADSPEDGDQ